MTPYINAESLYTSYRTILIPRARSPQEFDLKSSSCQTSTLNPSNKLAMWKVPSILVRSTCNPKFLQLYGSTFQNPIEAPSRGPHIGVPLFKETRKCGKDIKKDSEVQLLEDVICLVFIERLGQLKPPFLGCCQGTVTIIRVHSRY